MEFPEGLLYSKEHFWVRKDDNAQVTIGITDFAQDQLGELLYVDLPQEDDEIAFDDEIGAVESAKSVSDLICPVTGKVLKINEALLDDPKPVNEDPFNTGWMAVVELTEELSSDLMDAEAYKTLVA